MVRGESERAELNVPGCEILAKNAGYGQGTMSKRKSRMADKQLKIWKMGKENE